jgi:hypothetical protein
MFVGHLIPAGLVEKHISSRIFQQFTTVIKLAISMNLRVAFWLVGCFVAIKISPEESPVERYLRGLFVQI